MDWLASLEQSAVATWVRESESIWAYPTILTLHTIGLGLLVGSHVVLSLRLLGAAPTLPVSPLLFLFRVMWIGFWLNAASGVALFIADATTFARQGIFYVKLGLILLGLGNARLLQRTLADRPNAVSGGARSLALLALVLWAGAITAGRLMAYQIPAR